MKIIHFCVGLEGWNGMANTARQFVAAERAAGHDSALTNDLNAIVLGVGRVHIHGAWLPAVHQAAKRGRQIGAEVVLRPAGSYDPVRRAFHAWKKLLIEPWEHAMICRADVVQATCRQEAEWIRAYHPSARVELTDIKRFFKFDLAGCAAKMDEIAARTDGMPLKVLYLGRRHPLKGVTFLEEAVARLNAMSARLPKMEGRKCVELQIVSNVYGAELERIWYDCDVLCLPTLSENFGRVVAEALAHGRPVITTDGAPAWENEPGVVYLKGYRDGGDELKIRLLVEALRSLEHDWNDR